MPKGVYERSEERKRQSLEGIQKSPITQGQKAMMEPDPYVPSRVDFVMKLNELGAQPLDRKNEEELDQRFDISKQTMSEWENGVKGTTFQSDFAQKVKKTISAFREIAANEGKINTVWAIFMGKNYDGLKDQQDVVVTPNVIGQTDDATTLAEKYRANLPEITE